MIGNVATTAAANKRLSRGRPRSPGDVWNQRKPSGRVKLSVLLRKISGPQKSFQWARKAKISAVATAGIASGRMTRQKIHQLDAPSIWAASSYSWGMVMKNWRIKKMVNAPPPAANQYGTINGRNVSSQPT